jgi:hypothetical protein
LNKYSFLITFIHELAHLKVYKQYINRVSPHGKEWKKIYKELMMEYIQIGVFPEVIQTLLEESIKNAKASSTSDLKLSRALHQFDNTTGHVRIEELPTEAIFKTQNGKQFKKGERVRTRYKCLNLQNDRIYLFNPLTPVIQLN